MRAYVSLGAAIRRRTRVRGFPHASGKIQEQIL